MSMQVKRKKGERTTSPEEEEMELFLKTVERYSYRSLLNNEDVRNQLLVEVLARASNPIDGFNTFESLLREAYRRMKEIEGY